MSNSNRPTPMNDTIRSMPPILDRSTRNSLTTTTASSAAPAIQPVRDAMRFATTIVASAITVHRIESTACTSVDDHIASGEDIRSVRFDGDRGYMVTFKKTDPLYVFDLSDETQPRALQSTDLGESTSGLAFLGGALYVAAAGTLSSA